MNAKQLKEKVEGIVKGGRTNRSEIAAELLKEGATLSMVNRELPKVLIELGVAEKRESILAQVRAHLKGRSISIPETAEEFGEQCKIYADEMETECDDRFIKAVRVAYKEAEIEVPSKPNLGRMKSLMVTYFAVNKKRSLKGLATYMEKSGVDAEKALHFARMNYTFGEAISEAVGNHNE